MSNTQEHKTNGYVADLAERPAGERWITMSNALTRAGHGLSLAEKRVVFIAISKMDSRKALHPDTALTTSRITAAEYAELAECDMNTAYEALKDASKALYDRSITFFEAAHKRKGKDMVKVYMRWVGKVKYHNSEGWTELWWWPEILPHLTGLRKQFTSYQLKQASALRSAYSWRLLELLTRFESTGWAEYDIEDFATSMDATEKQRENFNNIKRRIIEPAVKELQEKDGWKIDWQPIKGGRKVKAVRFTFERDPQGRLSLEGGN